MTASAQHSAQEALTHMVPKLKSLYTQKHPKHTERAATVLPLSEQVRVLRAQHAELLARYEDVAHEVALVDMTQLARYVDPAHLPYVRKAYDAAKRITGAGTVADAVDAVRRAEAGIDQNTDSEYERNVQEAERLVKLLSASVAGLRHDVDAMVTNLDFIASATALASPTVNVPARDALGFIFEPVR